MKKMYAVKSPSGILCIDTTSTNRAWSWHLAYEKYLHKHFDYVYALNSTKKAYSNGWRCVEVKVIEK